MPAAGLAAMCPRRASQAYQPDTAVSLRAALAGESSAAARWRAYRATCSPVTPVTGCTPSPGTTLATTARDPRGAGGDTDVAGVGGPGVLRSLPGQPAEHQAGHRIGPAAGCPRALRPKSRPATDLIVPF